MAFFQPLGPRVPTEPFSDFDNWLFSHKFDGLYLHSSLSPIHNPLWTYGLGAHTTRDLTAGTVVARIPKQCMLSVRTVSNDVLRDALQSEEDVQGIVGLTIAYIYENCKLEESPFHGYLTSFQFPDVPRFWRADEKLLLKGTEIAFSGDLETVSHLWFWVDPLDAPQTCVLYDCQAFPYEIRKLVWSPRQGCQ